MVQTQISQNIHYKFSFTTVLQSIRRMKERLLNCLVQYKTSFKWTFHCYKAAVCCVSSRVDTERATLRLQVPHCDPQEQHSSKMGPFNPSVLRSDGPALRSVPERTLFWEASQCPSQPHNCELNPTAMAQ